MAYTLCIIKCKGGISMEQLEKLAAFTAGFHLEDAPEAVVEAAKACVLDTVSVAIGAGSNQMYCGIKQVYLAQNLPGKHAATVWGSGEKAPVQIAAFLNAMAGHTLEMDDVHTGSKTHIGTVVVPAAWAAAEAVGADGKGLLEAIVCGYEVMSRIGMGFGVSSHRNKGWHVTGTAGTFGAAAACAKLYGFDAARTLSAFGLAGMQSCTTWAFLTGSATDKVMHPARAAASGVESCMLVQGGMTGTGDILNAADGGIFPMMSDGYDYDPVCKGLGETWEILNMDKKPYPCCRSSHGSIDAALALRRSYGIAAQDIDHVDIDTYLVGLKQCGMPQGSLKPTLPTEAKFSTPYVTATALLTGKVGLTDFQPDKIADPQRQALLARVKVHEAAEFTKEYPAHWSCRMQLTTRDGKKYTYTVPDASGSVAAPLTKAQLRSKAMNCCAELPEARLLPLFDALENLEKAQVLPETALR